MSILKDLVGEMAAGGSTGAGGVAAVPGGLFSGGAVDSKKSKKKNTHVLRRAMSMKAEDVVYIKPRPSWKFIGEAISSRDIESERNFDSTDVLSKIDAAEEKANSEEDVVTFGLEDEEGNIVKVRVREDQAEEFEATLATMLAGEDVDEDEDNTAQEIAEVLYELKDKFEIVDVEWGAIEGDEEEEQEVGAGGAEGPPPEGGAEGPPPEGGEGVEGGEEGLGVEDLEGGEGEGEMEAGMEEEPAGEEAAASALQQVIDMMKADADARKSEAEARSAEARAKESEYAHKAADSKIRQEEETLEMEAYYDGKKKEDDEAKRLAKMAKFRHDKASEAGRQLQSESVEDMTNPTENANNEESTLDDVAEWILHHLRSQG